MRDETGLLRSIADAPDHLAPLACDWWRHDLDDDAT
jgi:hypothetical protein